MKNKKSEMSLLVAAAIMGISSVASAQQNCTTSFTPLENLSAQQRIIVIERLHEIEKVIKIDWESVLIGIDENGDLILKDRKIIDNGRVVNPSCWVTN